VAPDFWTLLSLFWDEDRIEKWKSTIFPDSENAEIGVESCFNLICLSPDAHVKWTKGLFALKPLKLSHDRKELIVRFFWQVPGNYDIGSRIDLLTEPTSSEGLDTVPNGHWLARLENDGLTPRVRPIRSGETFTFTTKDPKNIPLPSMELRGAMASPSSGGNVRCQVWNRMMTFSIFEDSWLIPEYTDGNVHNSLKRVREWVGTRSPRGMGW